MEELLLAAPDVDRDAEAVLARSRHQRLPERERGVVVKALELQLGLLGEQLLRAHFNPAATRERTSSSLNEPPLAITENASR